MLFSKGTPLLCKCSVQTAEREIAKNEELLVELFWTAHVYQKKLTKSHDYSRLFSKEKRRLKMTLVTCPEYQYRKPQSLRLTNIFRSSRFQIAVKVS